MSLPFCYYFHPNSCGAEIASYFINDGDERALEVRDLGWRKTCSLAYVDHTTIFSLHIYGSGSIGGVNCVVLREW